VIYLDTSVLDALFFREPTTPAIRLVWKPSVRMIGAFQPGT
jgi:hypothetical protein